jgi:hypothetical protein
VILYRPVGAKELDLIKGNDYRSFPPRLPEQPIFYPVLTQDYAEEIAAWNLKDPASGYKGYILQFEIDDNYIKSYQTHEAGGKSRLEYWIPADELELFNQHIIGQIVLIKELR